MGRAMGRAPSLTMDGPFAFLSLSLSLFAPVFTALSRPVDPSQPEAYQFFKPN